MSIPMTSLHDELIEAMARAICPDWFGPIVDGNHILDNYPDQHKHYQATARKQAAAALTAAAAVLERRGMKVLPKEATEKMTDTAHSDPVSRWNHAWELMHAAAICALKEPK